MGHQGRHAASAASVAVKLSATGRCPFTRAIEERSPRIVVCVAFDCAPSNLALSVVKIVLHIEIETSRIRATRICFYAPALSICCGVVIQAETIQTAKILARARSVRRGPVVYRFWLHASDGFVYADSRNGCARVEVEGVGV
jgi:hypothetical protein